MELPAHSLPPPPVPSLDSFSTSRLARVYISPPQDATPAFGDGTVSDNGACTRLPIASCFLLQQFSPAGVPPLPPTPNSFPGRPFLLVPPNPRARGCPPFTVPCDFLNSTRLPHAQCLKPPLSESSSRSPALDPMTHRKRFFGSFPSALALLIRSDVVDSRRGNPDFPPNFQPAIFQKQNGILFSRP